jgi:predicted ribosome quality control (RQC) complex YloA/Tae2 family protein
MGTPFSSKQPDCEPDTPPLRKWREKWGDSLEEALNGQIAEVLPGEGTLFQRHIEWSIQRAEKLLLQPKALAANRKIIKERQRLERYGKALAEDLVRHRAAIGLREPAGKLNAELWRLKGACGSTELLDGTIIEIPPSMSAEGAVQKWFGQAKKAERGLARVEALERERTRQIIGLELPCGENDGSAAPHILLAENPKAARQSRPKEKLGHGKKKMTDEKTHKRNDGKGRAFRSQIVEGFEVLIGKGDADNDNLTFKVASPSDFWLHVAAVPGSHVIIRNPDKISEPPRDVLERAAGLAAFYSKARDGGKVEVHWCRVADVNKPRGFEPGKVFLKNHKSLKVYPKQ